MFNFAGEVLILTGPPGSGKTTTAQALAGEPGSPKVHLHADDFWHFIKNGAVAPYLPEAHEQNRVVVEVLAKVAEGYANGGYFVVVDGIIGPWFLQPFKALTVSLHYVVLRPALDAAIQRCRERGGNTLADPEPITALYQQLSSIGELERHVVRTEGHSPRATLNAVNHGRERWSVSLDVIAGSSLPVAGTGGIRCRGGAPSMDRISTGRMRPVRINSQAWASGMYCSRNPMTTAESSRIFHHILLLIGRKVSASAPEDCITHGKNMSTPNDA